MGEKMRTTRYQDDFRSPGREPGKPAPTSLAGGFVLSVILAFGILFTLIYLAGPWDFLAVTRVLDVLIEGGIIQYHDRNPGFIAGLPDVKYYLMAQDPIDWRLVFVAALLLIIYPTIKAIQFDRIARAYGSPGTFGEHVRAYYYGDGLDRFLPFNMGRVAVAQILVKNGYLTSEAAAGAVFVSQAFTLFEITAFAVIGLFLLGWTEWFSQIVWAVIFLGAAIFLIGQWGRMSAVPPVPLAMRSVVQAFVTLAQRSPGLFVQLCVLSLAAFGTLDVAVYTVLNAFNTTVVLIAVEPPLLLMGIVGGYIAARLVPVTPGGIGQWELGFATGMYLGGADVSLALVSVALLTNLLRILTSMGVMGLVVLRYGVPTDLRGVYDAFLHGRLEAPHEQPPVQEKEEVPERAPVA